MPSTVWIGGVDLDATLPGILFSDLPDHLTRPAIAVPRVEIPGRPGGLAAGPARVGTREFTLTGYLDAGSLANTRALLDVLNSLWSPGQEVSVRTADRSDRELLAHLVALPARPYKPELLSPWVAFDIRLEALHPYLRDVTATELTLTTSKVPVPCGTAPHGGLLRILGAATPVVDPVVEYFTNAEALVATSTFTVSLASGDWIEIDLDQRTVRTSIASVVTQNDALLTAGVFPHLIDHQDGTFRTAAWPKLQLSATSGTPAGTLTYRRQWQ